MQKVEFLNVEQELTGLQDVLRSSLEEGRLDIAKINRHCEKFQDSAKCCETLKKAYYVIFSKRMLNYHHHETFIFINKKGEMIDSISDSDFLLYDMIEMYNTEKKQKEFVS